MSDVDLLTLESTNFDPYAEEREEIRKQLDEQAKETFNDLLNSTKKRQ